MAAQDLFIAIDRKDPDELEIVLNYSKEGLNDRYKGITPLWYAISKEEYSEPIVELLLRNGADPNIREDTSQRSDYPINRLISMGRFELAMLLVRHGADTSLFDMFSRWPFIEHHYRKALNEIDGGSYLKLKHQPKANRNPQNLTSMIKEAIVKEPRPIGDFEMICNWYVLNDRELWTLSRESQSITILPNKSAVLIAGYRESIEMGWIYYNDVAILTTDGDFTLYGYPEVDFPLIHGHSATRIGNSIYIVGTPQARDTSCEVYRLSLDDFHIEHCKTTGSNPGPVYGHRAKLTKEGKIHIFGENWAKGTKDFKLKHTYQLCITTLRWSIVQPSPPNQ